MATNPNDSTHKNNGMLYSEVETYQIGIKDKEQNIVQKAINWVSNITQSIFDSTILNKKQFQNSDKKKPSKSDHSLSST